MNRRPPDHEETVDWAIQAAEPGSSDPTVTVQRVAPEPSERERLVGARYGTADVSASGIDRSQLRRNLQLTPTERVARMVALVRSLQPLQGAIRRSRSCSTR